MKQTGKLLTAVVVTSTALWTVQAAAQTKTQMQDQINNLQQQVNNLQQEVSSSKTSKTKSSSNQSSSNGDPLTIGGGVVGEYQYKDYGNNRPGGHFILDYFDLNVSGKTKNGFSYAADERFSTTNFANSNYLHYGWAAYNFGMNGEQQIKGGLFQEPFGMLTYGYQTFWGNLAYYAGFTDHQGAGLGYKYQSGAWRFDADFYKNDNFMQKSTYAAGVPTSGYNNENTGNLRLAYTMNKGEPHYATFSISGKGGQLYLDGGNQYGNRWAASAAMNGHWGPWILQLQAVDYAYNVPKNATTGGKTPVTLPRDAITAENYGFDYQMPAKGQIYAANVARDFKVNWGPFSKVELYDNYGYLDVGGNGRFEGAAPGSASNPTGNIQMNAAGAEFVAGPVYIWADVLSGKNAALAFIGKNDGNWHTRFNLTLAYYFSGTFHS